MVLNIFGSLSVCILTIVFLVGCTEQSVKVDPSSVEIASIDKRSKYELTQEIPVILFSAGSTRLSNKARKQIRQIAILINQPEVIDQPILIDGHSDTLGNAHRNMVLSRKRAEVVSRELVLNGVRHSRLTVHALGESQPMISDIKDDGQPDPEAADLNRRVEILLGKIETADIQH